MASTVIHMVVANEINKVLKKDNGKLLIGSIAPDISKLIGETKQYSHFLNSTDTDIPDIDRFLVKYKYNLNDDFVLGYFIHLYTDYLWFKYFIPDLYYDDYITKLDGTKVKCEGRMLCLYLYNDYTNLNIKLLDEYNMDLSIFYTEIPKFNSIIEEIPMDRLKVIIDKASIIIANSKVQKDMIVNIDYIKKFIDMSVDLILAKLKDLRIVEE